MRMRRIKAAVTLLAFVLVLLAAVPVQAGERVLTEAAILLDNFYVDPVSQEVLNAPTIEEMLKRLGDPHSTYMDAEEFKDYLDSLNNNFSGLGIHLEMVAEGVKVQGVIANSPAEKAGLQESDIILKVNGRSLQGLDSDAAVNQLRGPRGSQALLQVKRGEEVIDISLIREEIELASVQGEMLNQSIAYIDIDSFGDRTAVELGNLFSSLKDKGARKWIIDLRDNPGGYVSTAAEAAGYFIGDARVITMKERNKQESYPAVEQPVMIDGPVVVLINEYSASAAEILSAALKDYGRVIVLGNRSYGKGTVQQIFPLSDGGVLKLTVARFYSPSGHKIDRNGVIPDMTVAEDNIFAAALLLLADDYHSNEVVPGCYRIDVGKYSYVINPSKVQQPDYWEAWRDLADDVPELKFYRLGEAGWSKLDLSEAQGRWSIYYPEHKWGGDFTVIAANSPLTIYLSTDNDIDLDRVELVKAASGERIPVQVSGSSRQLMVLCKENLDPAEYWLVANAGAQPSGGIIATIEVGGGVPAVGQ